MSKRIRIKISYDGTAYHGWQIQDGMTTVEGVLTEAVREAVGEDVEIIGASRTDSGVHAFGNVAVFDTDSPIPADKMSMVLNKLLPDDISTPISLSRSSTLAFPGIFILFVYVEFWDIPANGIIPFP